MSYSNYIKAIEDSGVREITSEEKYILATVSWMDIDRINFQGSKADLVVEEIGRLVKDGQPISISANYCRDVISKLDANTTSIINAYINRYCEGLPDAVHIALHKSPNLNTLVTVLGFEALLACAIGVLTENPMLIIYAIDAYVLNLGTGKGGTGVMDISAKAVKEYVERNLPADNNFYLDPDFVRLPYPFYTDGNNNYCYDCDAYVELLTDVQNGNPIKTELLFPALTNGLSTLHPVKLEPATTKGTTMFTLTDNQKNIIDAVLKPTGAPSASERMCR